MKPVPRTAVARLADTIHRLEAHDADAWVATASSAGMPHLVPLSFAWHDERILLATPAATPTVRNIVATGRARLAFGDSSDVVLMDAEPELVVDAAAAPEDLTRAFRDQAGWDPRRSSGSNALVVLHPIRILAWNGEHEWDGRVVMDGGAWVV